MIAPSGGGGGVGDIDGNGDGGGDGDDVGLLKIYSSTEFAQPWDGVLID